MITDLYYVYFGLIVIRVRELVKQGGFPRLEGLDYHQLKSDILQGVTFNFTEKFNDEIGTSGFILSTFISRPHLFLRKVSSELLTRLLTLKKQGKVVCLVTNAQFGFYSKVIKYILGQEVLSVFDYVVVHSRKPSFFTSENDFFAVDETNKKDKKGKATDGKDYDFENNRVWFHGNHNHLMNHLRSKMGKETLKGVYFGDSIRGDSAA